MSDHEGEPIEFLDFLEEIQAELDASSLPDPEEDNQILPIHEDESIDDVVLPLLGVPLTGKILVEFKLSINGYKQGDQAWLEADKVQGLINQGMCTLVTL